MKLRTEYYDPVMGEILTQVCKESDVEPNEYPKTSPPATEATYAACLLACGPHLRGRLGDSEQFNHYYNRLYAWYREQYFDWSSGHWLGFYNAYFDWIEGSKSATRYDTHNYAGEARHGLG